MSSNPETWTVLAMLEWATDYFKKKQIPDARLSIEWILAEVLSVKRLDLYVQFDRPLTRDELSRIRPLVKRRALNEPLQYIIGKTQFFSAEISVNPSVLIPRIETEQLVDLFLNDGQYGSAQPISVLDVGTGSGCIPIAIKLNRPVWNCAGVDISQDALQVAALNADDNKTDIKFVQADFEHWETSPFLANGAWDVIISNPPYITMQEKNDMHKQVTGFEPHLALFHKNPLQFYEKLIDFASKAEADLFVECNDKTAKQVEHLAVKKFSNVSLHKDLDENPRFVVAKFH